MCFTGLGLALRYITLLVDLVVILLLCGDVGSLSISTLLQLFQFGDYNYSSYSCLCLHLGFLLKLFELILILSFKLLAEGLNISFTVTNASF